MNEWFAAEREALHGAWRRAVAAERITEAPSALLLQFAALAGRASRLTWHHRRAALLHHTLLDTLHAVRRDLAPSGVLPPASASEALHRTLLDAAHRLAGTRSLHAALGDLDVTPLFLALPHAVLAPERQRFSALASQLRATLIAGLLTAWRAEADVALARDVTRYYTRAAAQPRTTSLAVADALCLLQALVADLVAHVDQATAEIM